MPLWAKSVRIFNSIREHGKSSIRRLAERTGFSKSSVHRHLQAIDRRDRYPESKLWETPEGRTWLIRLVVATLFIFGLKRGVGADTISEFFGRLHLEAHVGCSPSALRGLMQRLELTLMETAAAWEQDGIDHGEIRPIIGAVDETFLQRMMLVFMDLASGYLVMEEVAVHRTYETWSGLVRARLKTLGAEVSFLVSDRAKALIKLAQTGLDCLSIPDVFHLSHDLAKGYSLTIFSRLRQAQQALTQAQERLARAEASHPGGVQSAGTGRGRDPPGRSGTLADGSQRLSGPSRQSRADSASVESFGLDSTDLNRGGMSVEAEVKALETLIATHGLPAKDDTLTKVRKQLAGISALIDFWWQTVDHDLEDMVLNSSWKDWVDELLLPMMYWQEQLSRTRCPGQKAQIALALKVIQEDFERHPCTGRFRPRCSLTGRAGQPIMPRPSSALHQQLKVETVTCRRCSTIIGACPNATTQCGRCYTILIVTPQMERHPLRDFSDGSSLISLRMC